MRLKNWEKSGNFARIPGTSVNAVNIQSKIVNTAQRATEKNNKYKYLEAKNCCNHFKVINLN